MPSQYPNRPRTVEPHGQAAPGAPPHPPEQQEQLPCPRCDSTDTKFCYYNNYNFSQPRHFCKSCRRYWTHGGTLRDIPVGGGNRKTSKRPRTSSASTSSSPILPPLDGSGAINGSVQSSGVAAEAPKQVCGSFTSLLTTQDPTGFLSLGGLGLEDMAFGLGKGAAWAFPGEADGVAVAGTDHFEAFGRMGSTWQLEGGAEGGGDRGNGA